MEQCNPGRTAPQNAMRGCECPAFLRALQRAYADELSAVTDYTYASILLQRALPSASSLLLDISKDEMHHYRALGELLRELGASFALSARVTNTPYRLNEDEDSHAVAVTRRILRENLPKEQSASTSYQKLANVAKSEVARALLTELARDEEAHAVALGNLAKKLAYS